MPLVVSLSSIPSRFDKLDPVLDALLAQKAKIDEIRLYIPRRYRRFPDFDGPPPRVPKGVRVIRPDDDLGPASKVLFAADDLKGTDCDIIYCDDDRLYEPHWFSGMLRQRGRHTDRAVATACQQLHNLGYRVANRRKPQPVSISSKLPRAYGLVRRKIKQLVSGKTDRKPPHSRLVLKGGYCDIAEGTGAVLLRPDFFDAAVYDIPPVLWSVDDVWLSGHLERRGIPIWLARGYPQAQPAEHTSLDALYASVVDGAGRNEANAACIAYFQKTYGIWQEIDD